MAEKAKLPPIDFAKRHIETDVSTFNAYSALVRLDILLDDAKMLNERLQAVPESAGWTPWGHSISNYYLAGYVTCLEWHARSRLYDLYVFAPESIDPAELKQSVSAASVAQLLSENLTVAHLIAGATNVSSADRYASIFNRIFEAVGSPAKMSGILDEQSVDEVTFGAALSELFVERNSLIHEINWTDIGHLNIRHILSLEDVILLGEKVEAIMKKVEAEITRFARDDFPSLLDADGYPRDEIARLEEAITLTENFIAERIGEGNSNEGLTAAEWRTQCASFRAAISAELDGVRALMIPGQQYHDIRPSIMKTILKQRLTYLTTYRNLFIFDPEDAVV